MSIKREDLSDDVTIWLGDCREVLPTVSPHIDGIISDPPYGIAYVKGSGGRGIHSRRNHGLPLVGDDSPFDPTPFTGVPAILWGANHYAARLPHGRWLAWNKLGHMEPWDSFSDVEFAWQNMRGSDRIFSLLWKGLAQGVKEDGGARAHPTQKPIALMRWCVEQLHGRARTIFDPYMGSGTTGVACVQLGRRFVGVEIEPRYFDVARRRLEAEIAKPRLPLEAPAPTMRQPALFDGGAA